MGQTTQVRKRPPTRTHPRTLAPTGNCDYYVKLLMEGMKSPSVHLVQCSIIALATVYVEHYAEISDVVAHNLITSVAQQIQRDEGPVCSSCLFHIMLGHNTTQCDTM